MSKKQQNTALAIFVGAIALIIIGAIVKDWLDKHPWAYVLIAVIAFVILIVLILLLIALIKARFST